MKKSFTYRIINNKDAIEINYKDGDTLCTVSNTPQVRALLDSKCFHLSKNDNERLRVRISYKRKYKDKPHIYLSQLLYAFYRENVTVKNMHKRIPELIHLWNNYKLQVDHLDGDINNNCIYNLSLMPAICNQKKSRKATYRQVFNIVQAYDGEGYRVKFTYISVFDPERLKIRSVYYYCKTPCALNNLLKYIKRNRWYILNSRKGVIEDNKRYNVGFFCKLIPKEDKHILQEELLKESKEIFTLWQG